MKKAFIRDIVHMVGGRGECSLIALESLIAPRISAFGRQALVYFDVMMENVTTRELWRRHTAKVEAFRQFDK